MDGYETVKVDVWINTDVWEYDPTPWEPNPNPEPAHIALYRALTAESLFAKYLKE